jgi:uncharacterized surface protein with fasciclin (FAS1) repeats
MKRNPIRSIMLLAGALLIALPAASALAGKGNYGDRGAKNIVQVAQGAGTFNTLVAAVEAAGLTGALSGQGQGPLTVFAPTDAAFAKLGDATIQALLADPAKLAAILKYHVVAGEVKAAQVVGLSSAPTLNGASVNIAVNGNTVTVNGAKVLQTDIAARNGVIHVIDTVLLPPGN